MRQECLKVSCLVRDIADDIDSEVLELNICLVVQLEDVPPCSTDDVEAVQSNCTEKERESQYAMMMQPLRGTTSHIAVQHGWLKNISEEMVYCTTSIPIHNEIPLSAAFHKPWHAHHPGASLAPKQTTPSCRHVTIET